MIDSNINPCCVVKGCNGFFMTSNAGPYYALLGLDETLLKSWLRACGFSDEEITDKINNMTDCDVICATHFMNQEYRHDVPAQRNPCVFPQIQKNTSQTLRLSEPARRLSQLISARRSIMASGNESNGNDSVASPVPQKVEQPPKRCIVPECDGYFQGELASEGFKPKYFTLPVKDERLLNEWLLAIGIPKDADLSAGKICCSHFKDGKFSLSDPLHRMPIVFAPKISVSSAPQPQKPAVKATGLKSGFRPSFTKKPTVEKTSSASRSSVAAVSSSESESESDVDTGSTSDESFTVQPQLHSGAVVPGKTSLLSLFTPNMLFQSILNNYETVRKSSVEDADPWEGLVESDVSENQAFGFGDFLYTLGLDIVRRRVYKTALKATKRQEKRKQPGPIMTPEMKALVKSSVDTLEQGLGIDRLDNYSTIPNIQCNRCSFSSESQLVVDWHRRQPHFDRTHHGFVDFS